MERQEQTIHKAEDRRTEEPRTDKTKQETLSASWAAQAILAGTEMWDLPPRTLEELATRVGNSGMLTLMSLGVQEPQQTSFSPPDGEVHTVPFPVPALDCQTAEPTGLTAETPPGPAFDPENLSD